MGYPGADWLERPERAVTEQPLLRQELEDGVIVSVPDGP